LIFDPDRVSNLVEPDSEKDEEQLKEDLQQARKTNFGFERVERLKGNVGYIDIREFVASENAGPTAVAAMNFVANCDALIIDIRKAHGGNPSMVQLITSYLVEPKPIHINTFYYRPTESIQQFWTFPHVPGVRRPDIPVYVLVSKETGSGAEEFAYNLKQMKRAALVGEITVGAAHPVTLETVCDKFILRLPYGRPINPITQENWEGTGVEPDIKTPAHDALQTAHLKAVKQLISQSETDSDQRDLVWALEIIETDYFPPVIDATALNRFAGKYGKRVFSVSEGTLIYGHEAMPVTFPLKGMTGNRFRLDEDMKFEFSANNEGMVDCVAIEYKDGRPDVRVEKD
jgi:hypothetical protein